MQIESIHVTQRIFLLSNAVIIVGFNPTVYSVNEADGEEVLFVEILNGTLERDVTVLFETLPGTATQAGNVMLCKASQHQVLTLYPAERMS